MKSRKAELSNGEFAKQADALKATLHAEFATEREHHVEVLEAIHQRYWSKINALIEKLHPSSRRKALRYANGDPDVYKHRKQRKY
jgi:hypothetical protein